MDQIAEFLTRSAEQCGLHRSFYLEKNIPKSFDQITVIPFFGDIKSTCILSSFLLNQYRQLRPNQYLILVSWPGVESLFPYVNEFWHPQDKAVVQNLSNKAQLLDNDSDEFVQIHRSLNQRFEDIFCDFKSYYTNGFEGTFWNTFQTSYRYLPEIVSTSKLNANFLNSLSMKHGQKVALMPTTHIRSWHRGKGVYLPSSKSFWVSLIQRLLDEQITPVIIQNSFTFDLSPEFADRCVYLASSNFGEILSGMRQIGCLIDVFGNISNLAQLARCASIVVDERQRYIFEKDNELDIFYGNGLKQHIFSFATLTLSGDEIDWKNSIIDTLIARLKKFLPTLDHGQFGSTTASSELFSNENIKQKKMNRLGTRFIRKY